MADFVNTIDLLGDKAVLAGIISNTFQGEFRDNVVKKIKKYSFEYCDSLTSADLPKVTTVEDYAFFKCTALTNINIPNATNLGASVFKYCSNITSVDFPKVTSVGMSVFEYCSSLTSAKLPLLTSLVGAFNTCRALTEVYVPRATKTGSGAFIDCTSLTFLDLPSMTEIGNQAFYGCVLLKTIALRSTTPCTLSTTNAFYGVNASTSTPFYQGGTGGTLLAPSALVESYKTATNWSVIWGYGHNRFLALEDYTVDGTITGEIDWDKLNGGN